MIYLWSVNDISQPSQSSALLKPPTSPPPPTIYRPVCLAWCLYSPSTGKIYCPLSEDSSGSKHQNVLGGRARKTFNSSPPPHNGGSIKQTCDQAGSFLDYEKHSRARQIQQIHQERGAPGQWPAGRSNRNGKKKKFWCNYCYSLHYFRKFWKPAPTRLRSWPNSSPEFWWKMMLSRYVFCPYLMSNIL